LALGHLFAHRSSLRNEEGVGGDTWKIAKERVCFLK